MSELPRVYILGGPGSGKSRLAGELAGLSGAKYFDLDLLAWYWDEPGGLKTQDELAELVREILMEPGWITEGIYHGWTDPLIDNADLVVWLDPPWPVAMWRVFLRHLRAELRRDNRHPGWWRLFKFLGIARSYYTQKEPPENWDDWNRVSTEPYADKLGARMIRVARITPEEVLRQLKQLPRRQQPRKKLHPG